MAAARKTRDWKALERKVVPPEGWEDWTPTEKNLFLLVRAVSPPLAIKDIADELDLSLSETVSMLDRREMRTSVPAARVPVGEFLKLLETACKRVLVAMDAAKIEQADLKGLSATFRDLMNTRALLLGEPTQIISSDHRRSMADALQVLVAEATRRGIAIQTDQQGGITVRRPVTIDAQGRPV
jgi:hypothetical protein